MTTSAAPTATFTASGAICFRARFGTATEAADFAASLPKMVKPKIEGGDPSSVRLQVSLLQNDVTGSANEGGIRRIRRFVAALRAVGVEPVRTERLRGDMDDAQVAEIFG